MRFCKGQLIHRCSAIITGLALTLASTSTSSLNAETFGDQSLGWTRDQEAAVAGYLQRRLQRQGLVINDVWVEYWLHERAERLRQASNIPLYELTTLTIDDSRFNAFALPGNVMGFNLGLWRTAETEAEFVSVMGHELAHLKLRHFSRLQDASRQQSWLAISGALLGIALMTSNSELGAATFTGAQASAIQQSLAFSRTMESEADDLSSRTLAEIGYDAHAGAQVFRRMQQQIAYQTSASDYWQSHPLPASRVARLDDLDENTNPADQPDHNYDVVRWHLNRAHRPNDNFAPWPARYRALLLAKPNGSVLPDELLQQADPDLMLGWILHQKDQFNPTQVSAQLANLTQLFPDFDPGWFWQAQWMSKQEDTGACRQARAYLDNVEDVYLEVLELSQQLAARCQPERETEARAAWLWYSGEESAAINLLRQAIEQPANTSQLARLRQQLTMFERQRNLLPS
ncbi:M48 family metallopeptidase [Saccharospirillum mangrovi]|uniref:M48 family metallopeptidase n=1 Tax=Saccharospirillum mangrovi TaxID=2161747 RepID=UPI000D35A1DE|nr:M48 family metalloprotease [Saccharospirillum mangrovi]